MNRTLLLMVCFIGFSLALPQALSAQQEGVFRTTEQLAVRETMIYVPPIDGIGYIDDLAFFYKQITTEIVSLHRTLGRTRPESDYVLTGTIMPIEELIGGFGAEEEDSPFADFVVPEYAEIDEFVLFIELYDNSLEEVISTQYIVYLFPDEDTLEALSIIIYNMLSIIPDSLEHRFDPDIWRNRLLYLGLNFLWVPRGYFGDYQSVNFAGVGVETKIDFHFTDFLALKLSGAITQDYIGIYATPRKYVQDMVLDASMAFAFVLRPRDIFMLEPYGGIVYNTSLNRKTQPSPLSWIAGFTVGVKTGLGIITLDPSFSMDIFESITVGSDRSRYRRYSPRLSIGYKIGFFDRFSFFNRFNIYDKKKEKEEPPPPAPETAVVIIDR